MSKRKVKCPAAKREKSRANKMIQILDRDFKESNLHLPDPMFDQIADTPAQVELYQDDIDYYVTEELRSSLLRGIEREFGREVAIDLAREAEKGFKYNSSDIDFYEYDLDAILTSLKIYVMSMYGE
jgi:hypothetical protein